MDVISLNDPNEGIPMPLMHDMLFEDSFICLPPSPPAKQLTVEKQN